MKNIRQLFKRKVTRSTWGNIILVLVMLIFGSFVGLPLVYAISNSLKPPNELWIFPPRFFVSNPTFNNFTNLFGVMNESIIPFSRYFANSAVIVVLSTIFYVLFTSMCAYPLAKYKFPFSRTYFAIIVTSLMFSTTVMQIPNYMVFSKLGLINTFWTIILPATVRPLGLFLMKQFIEQNIPDSLLESAEIDGANEWIKYWKIVMPLVKPAWLTLMILSVQELWSAPSNPFIYSEELKTLTYAFAQIQQGGVARFGVSGAIQVIVLAVPLTIFILCQSRIIETMSVSGIKD
jgi:ABC-type glycerol-3-phosphate transport system permease component